MQLNSNLKTVPYYVRFNLIRAECMHGGLILLSIAMFRYFAPSIWVELSTYFYGIEFLMSSEDFILKYKNSSPATRTTSDP